MYKINVSNISRLRTYTDGDGVSTLIGSMGCPLRCAYCFNPFSWDGSLEPKTYAVDELYEEVKRDNIYFLSTGGGLVFGGGEPLLYHEFIKEFIKKYKSTGWKFTLETSLSVKKDILRDIIDYIDFFIVDTKDMDKNRYELYTKGDYELFLSNLKFLIDKVGSDRIRVRVPKIPKLNTVDDVKTNYRTLKDMGFSNIDVFNYVEIAKHRKISRVALENKKDFDERLYENKIKFVEDYILSEIMLKVPPILDFHIKKFPDSFNKKFEFLFEYDSIFNDDLFFLKEVVISKLQECYDYLDLKYGFFVIFYPVSYLENRLDDSCFDLSIMNNLVKSFEGLDEIDKEKHALELWEENKWEYIEFKYFCHDLNHLKNFYVNFKDHGYKLDSKYILSNAYDVCPSDFVVHINLRKTGKTYNIVEEDYSTHLLVQKFDKDMNLISQSIFEKGI